MVTYALKVILLIFDILNIFEGLKFTKNQISQFA